METHRDRVRISPGRRSATGDAAHRKIGAPTFENHGKPSLRISDCCYLVLAVFPTVLRPLLSSTPLLRESALLK